MVNFIATSCSTVIGLKKENSLITSVQIQTDFYNQLKSKMKGNCYYKLSSFLEAQCIFTVSIELFLSSLPYK